MQTYKKLINCAMFKLNKLNTHQQKPIELLVNEEKDTVVNLPTGCSKSIIYQGLHACII